MVLDKSLSLQEPVEKPTSKNSSYSSLSNYWSN